MATIEKNKSTGGVSKKIRTGKDMLPLYGILKDTKVDATKIRTQAWAKKS